MGLCHYWRYYWGYDGVKCVLWCYVLCLEVKCGLLLNEDEVEVKVNVKGVPSYQLE